MIARILGSIVAAGFLLIVSSGPTRAIELVTGNNYFPYTDERIPGGGISNIIVKAAFERMGQPANVTFMSWDDGYAGTRDGKFLATYPYIKTADRVEDFLYSEKLFSVRPHIFINYQIALLLEEPEDLIGRTLCVPKGWTIDNYLKKIADAGQLKVYNETTLIGCFQLLYQTRVDAVSIDRLLGTAAAKSVKNGAWFKVRRLTNSSSSNYLIISKQTPNAQDWIDKFNAALDSLRRDGTISRLTKEFYAVYP